MQSLRESHARAIKQILHYLKGTTSFAIKYKRGNDMRLAGYSSHNVVIDDGRNTTGHVFYLGTTPITWCSQKETMVALSSCESGFMTATVAACQAIWLRGVLAEVMENERDVDDFEEKQGTSESQYKLIQTLQVKLVNLYGGNVPAVPKPRGLAAACQKKAHVKNKGKSTLADEKYKPPLAERMFERSLQSSQDDNEIVKHLARHSIDSSHEISKSKTIIK
nr:zinc finger, CCHC-type [Tanacetum cinerariifolium]